MNFLELTAVLGLDKKNYDKGLDDASSKARSLVGGVGKIAKVAGGAMLASVGAAAAGVGKLVASSTKAYGEFEQLKGGVEKIFGDSADVVMDYANNAYTSAGLSANNYMQTVTSFSASLMQGLKGDTKKAAEIANKAIVDMSDNANTYGTDMVSIQNAYMGFAKNNYTMLDNLKLGYGGTAAEMARLIKDSGVLGKAAKDLTAKNLNEKVSFDKMIEAIHVMQERMNIAGTTSKEAGGTIQGSIGSVKGAWDNLVAGFSNPDADLGQLIDNVISTGSNALKNLLPTISNALKGIGKAVKEIVPIITKELPGLVQEILPPLLQAAVSLVNALLSALPSILSVLPDIVNSVLPPLLNAMALLLQALIKELPSILEILKGVVPMILEILIPSILDILPDVISTALELLTQIIQALADNAETLTPMLVEVITKIAEILTNPDVIVPLLEAGGELLIAITKGIANATPTLLQGIGRVIVNLVDTLKEAIPLLVTTAGGMVYELVARLGTALGDFLYDTFGTKIYDIIQKVRDKIDGARQFISDQVQKIKDFFSNLEFKLPDIKLPHFKLEGEFSLMPPKTPKIGVDWYAKGYNEAYMLNGATIFGAQGGKLLGGGERAGSEVVVGTQKLISMMSTAVKDAFNGVVIEANIPVYIGNKKLEDIIVKTQSTMKMKRGK